MIFPAVKRIICVGDLHGDFDALILSLNRAKVINKKGNWTGGDTYVVQMGDQVDGGGRGISFPGDAEMKIIHYITNLDNEAKKKGGRVISLIGNHELMNINGDFRYVSKYGMKNFNGIRNRRKLFCPGGQLCRILANSRYAVVKIGDWVFSHGGINDQISKKYSIEDMNKLLYHYMMGKKELLDTKPFQELYMSDNSVLWTRQFSDNRVTNAYLNRCLRNLGAKGMVVAHTPQSNGIKPFCNGKLWAVDVGMSRAYGKDSLENVEVLEILNNGQKFRVI